MALREGHRLCTKRRGPLLFERAPADKTLPPTHPSSAGDLIYDPATAFGIAEFAPGGKLTYRNVDGTLRRRQA